MKLRYILLILGLALSFNFAVHAQETDATSTTDNSALKIIQPTIMAIPFAKKGQSMRAEFENNELVRIAITKVKEAFDARGVNTIDLRAKLKQLNNTNLLAEDQQSTIKDEVISLSGADIYVEVEAQINKSNGSNSATVIMTAYDAFSGESLSNKIGNSPSFNTDKFSKLIQKAVDSEVDNLLNTIQEKFTDMRENGRTIVLTIGIAEDAEFDLDSEVDDSGALLSELIEDWVFDNAYKNYAHIQGTTEKKMIFDLVKVPIRDKNDRPYRVSKFAVKFRKFMKEKGLSVSRVINGNTIVLTISEEY